MDWTLIENSDKASNKAMQRTGFAVALQNSAFAPSAQRTLGIPLSSRTVMLIDEMV